jgi:WD40 repeat protein
MKHSSGNSGLKQTNITFPKGLEISSLCLVSFSAFHSIRLQIDMSRLYDTARNAYWRVRSLPLPPLVLLEHTNLIRSVAFLPDGKQVISGSNDRTIRAWRVEDGDEVRMRMKEGRLCVVAASNDGQLTTSGGPTT